MEQQKDLLELLHRYLQIYPHEAEGIFSFTRFVKNFEGHELYNRNNFTGHITASAFIFHSVKKSLLLIHHSTLDKWLQPGGHVEETDANLLSAALREAAEETGLEPSSFIPFSNIIDIDSHPIPANNKKQEPAHVHHDVRFLFMYEGDDLLQIQSAHVKGCKWLQMDKLPAEEGLQRVARKIAAM